MYVGVCQLAQPKSSQQLYECMCFRVVPSEQQSLYILKSMRTACHLCDGAGA